MQAVQASTQSFQPKFHTEYKAAFQVCLKKVLPAYQNRKRHLMIFDTCFGHRLYMGVIENQGDNNKQLLVIAKIMTGKEKAMPIVLNDIYTFISRVSKGTLNFTDKCETTPNGDLQLIYSIQNI